MDLIIGVASFLLILLAPGAVLHWYSKKAPVKCLGLVVEYARRGDVWFGLILAFFIPSGFLLARTQGAFTCWDWGLIGVAYLLCITLFMFGRVIVALVIISALKAARAQQVSFREHKLALTRETTHWRRLYQLLASRLGGVELLLRESKPSDEQK